MKQTSEVLMRAPTDLSNFLGCQHLSALDLRVARGELQRPVRHDEVLDDLRERGRAHEQAYLAHLRAQGLHVLQVTQRAAPTRQPWPRCVPASTSFTRQRLNMTSGPGVWTFYARSIRPATSATGRTSRSTPSWPERPRRERSCSSVSMPISSRSSRGHAQPLMYVVPPGTRIRAGELPGRRLWRVRPTYSNAVSISS